FLDIAGHLLVRGTSRSDGDDGHTRVDEGDGPVLHLARRVSFGVDVRDLLELEGALEGQGEVEPAPQIEEVVAVDEALRDPSNRIALPEHDRHEVRQLREPFDHLAHERGIDPASRKAELEREARDRYQL